MANSKGLFCCAVTSPTVIREWGRARPHAGVLAPGCFYSVAAPFLGPQHRPLHLLPQTSTSRVVGARSRSGIYPSRTQSMGQNSVMGLYLTAGRLRNLFDFAQEEKCLRSTCTRTVMVALLVVVQTHGGVDK